MAGGCTSNEAGSPTTFALAAGSFGTAPQAGEPSSKRQIEQRASRPHETDFAGAKTMISPLAGKLDKSGGRNDGRVNASSQAPLLTKSNTRTESKIPWFGDLPGVGALFL